MHGVILHGHFYQPPREHPWLETVEAEPSAAPDHDWNARITRECYAPLGALPLHDGAGRLARVVNAYAHVSFDVGPTLAEWLEREAPDTWAAMRAGDRAACERLGHGNAIAAPYHHVILPLCSRRDKVTEVRWGLADFRRRFGRDAEGFWLPECAVDEETLVVLAEEGVRFTLLAPWQVAAPHPDGLPLAWHAGGGRTIALCPYDGALAGDVAFGALVNDDAALAARIAQRAAGAPDRPTLALLATDGETFGHHHRRGAETLGRALLRLAAMPGLTTTNLAAWLAAHPPAGTAELRGPSAWSCAHGVGRWYRDCGCRAAADRPTSQAWRTPLRLAMTALAELAHQRFAHEGAHCFRDDPWAVRDGYGAVVGLDGDPLAAWVTDRLAPGADAVAARRLLELERAVLRCFTSCAWFFDDAAGLEVQQVLRYAARVLELGDRAAQWLPPFLDALSPARSAARGGESLADFVVHTSVPRLPPMARVAAGAAACAVRLGDPRELRRVGALDVLVGAHDVALHHRRTGERTRWRVVLSPDGTSAEVTALDPAGGPWQVDLRDFAQDDARRLLAARAADPLPVAG